MLYNVKACVTSVLMLSVLSLTLTVTTAAHAEQNADSKPRAEQKHKEKRKVRRAQTMRAKIFKKLDKIRELADAKQYAEAIEAVAAMEKTRRNSYEKAMTWNMLAYVQFNQENYAEAIKAYKQVLKTKKLSASLEQTTLYSIAKLYLVQDQYKEALGALNSWFAVTETPNPDAYVLRAQIYYQLENYASALPDIKKAISQTKKEGKSPRENWLLVERAVYYNNKDFVAMERCLKDLIALYPKPQYWVQLSAIYNELGNAEKELSVLESAYDQALLKKESHVVSLAQAMLSLDMPYKSAQVILDGLKAGVISETGKNLSLLGDALMIAKEYEQAIKIMTQAAALTQAPKDFYKLAQIHTERQEWKRALNHISKALSYEVFKNEDQALVLKGLVLFNLNKLDEASLAFDLATQFKDTEKTANQWLAFIAGEAKRREYLAQQAG
jgi:tetratricopeptide (TPR) repeat protein